MVSDREEGKALLKEIKAILRSRERKFQVYNEYEQDEISDVDSLLYCDNDEFNWCFLGDPIVSIVRKDDFDEEIKEMIRRRYPHEIKLDKKARIAKHYGCKLVYSGQAERQFLPYIDGITGRTHVRVYECEDDVIITVHKDTHIPHKQDSRGTIEELRRICSSEIGQFLVKQGIWTTCPILERSYFSQKSPHDRLS